MKYIYIIISWFLLMGTIAPLKAQVKKIKVTGKVLDIADNNPIPAVTILSGSPPANVGFTNSNGEFTVTVPENASLIFRYMGYKTITRAVNGKSKIDVTLTSESSALKEITVIGYQQKTKELSTGASTVISGKAVQDVPVGNVMELLQGKVAGLNIQNNNGSPGMRGSIAIRGLSNFNISGGGENAFLTPTSPLFVIDGIPVDENSNFEYGFQQAGPGVSPIALIPQEDIERIEVLKDAQATSLYGSRGAYGVILITTKRGNSKVPVIRYTTNFFLNTVPALRKVIGGKGERDLRIDQILRNDTSYYHSLDLLNRTEMLADSLNPYWNNSTDWQSYFYRQTYNQTHNLDVSGGDELFNYKVNLGYYNEKGIIENTGFDRYNLNMNMQYQPSSKFKLFASITNGLGKQSKGSGNGLLQTGVASGGASTSLLPPPSQFLATNSLLGTYSTVNDNKTINVAPNLEIQYQLLPGLRATTTLSYTYNTGTEDNFKPAAINNNVPEFYAYNDRRSKLYNRNLLSYNYSLKDKHNFNAYIFSELSKSYYKADATLNKKAVNDYIRGPLVGFISPGVGLGGVSLGGTLNNFTDARTLAFAGSFSYNYMQKYVLDLSYRMDGSSTNGPDAGFIKSPSIGLRWNFNKEEFLTNVKWLDYGSFRFSYGRNIVPNGTIYDVYGKYAAGGTYNNNPTVNIDLGKLPNTNLMPTTNTMLNAGFDVGLFKNRINFTYETYYKQVDNLFRSKGLSTYNSFTAVSTNESSLVNYGHEFSLSGKPLRPGGKLNWTLTANAAINKDVLTGLPNGVRELLTSGGTTGQAILYRLGINSLSNVLYNYTGVYNDKGQIPVDPFTGLKYRTKGTGLQNYFAPGDPIWTDLNGDYILDEKDLVVVGNSQPRVTGGINSFMQYKNFSLNLNFSFTLFRDILNNALAQRFQNFNNPTSTGALIPLDEFNYWKSTGKDGKYPNPFDFTRSSIINPFRYAQTLFQEDGSYLKINDLTLSYNLDKKITERFGINSIRIYGSARNIYTFSSYSGPNPESVTDLGVDSSNGYPNSRAYTLGLNVMF